ncbi:SDR family NAD(P)-dependent oxidoreductase [Streptomyces sp. NBC_00557]|jgi:NAD(P)-dependent dehydrogenase (short-subunit alcohol dehydrogenase family)|uniref:SDR family NAD(P)-dependent oxidoreductase n=1 Tax=Streptomyces sp. NBC_00557 TaxID=2975776 RepID=UPI002E8230CB|nr:SDR family NAD(P)-dependent oxidoreductase [Streptomyces sp. NBC_00557]WUC40217.1 SDR family NAD(P)-dependent oxidoreductase [Streptomyces sp. NBC_00557]
MNLQGKTVVVTGASSGLGEVAARRLHAAGAHVVPVGRSAEKTAAIAAELGTEPLTADFSELTEVRRLAKVLLDRCPRIDVLVNNAGCILSKHTVTKDGFEQTFQVNAVAPYMLTRLLTERLRDSQGRVLVTSSQVIEGRRQLNPKNINGASGYEPYEAYADSKLALALLTREYARRHPDIGVADFHPGVFLGGLARELWRERLLASGPLRGTVQRFVGTPEKGAETLLMLAGTDAPLHGEYYKDCRRTDPGATAEDPDVAGALWDVCAHGTGLPL